jgi:hypothetical protein
VCDTGYVLGAVDVVTDLVLVHHGRMHKWLGITYLCHRQIPVLPYDVFKVDESHWHHPIFDWRWVWVEGEYLQLYRVEIVYWDRRLGVGVQIFVQLLQDGMDFEGCLWRRQERRLFLRFQSTCGPYIRETSVEDGLTSQAVRTRFTFRTTGS